MVKKVKQDIEEVENLESIERLIKDGKIRATCPMCSNILDSIFIKKCDICNLKILIDEISLSHIDWSKAN
jgi:hypothetical protein